MRLRRRWRIPVPTTAVTREAARYGWVNRPAEVEAFLARLPKPLFRDAAASLMGTEHRDFVAWEQGEIPLLGTALPAHRQTVGDCVSHGGSRAIQDGLYIDQAHNRPAESPGAFWSAAAEVAAVPPPQIATEPLYAFSRVEVGGGRIRGDGSIGAWAAEAAKKYGVLSRAKYDGVDLTNYSGQLARSWGAPRSGVPDKLEPIARTHLVGNVAATRTGEEALAALYNCYCLNVCSQQGFTETRDSRGMCQPRGSWAHAMACRAVLKLKGGILVVVIQQSWGNSPTGNDQVELEDGRVITLPQGCFCVDFNVFVKRMLSAGDTFAFAGPAGFEPREPKPLDFWTPA